MTDALDYMKTHRFFRNLTRKQMDSLFQYCRVLECRKGSVLFYKNEVMDSLLMVLDGALALGEERAFTGNSLFLTGLALPVRCEHSVIASSDSKIIQIRREAFLRWVHQHPGVIRRLHSRTNRDWGFPAAFWRDYGALIPRRNRKEISHQLVLRRWWPLWLLRQLPLLLLLSVCAYFPDLRPGIFLLVPLVLAALLFRKANGLFIGKKAVVAKILRIRGLQRSVIKIPLEQVLAVEVHRKGLFRSIFHIGKLYMKTSSQEGSLVIPGLFRPERAEFQLNQLKQSKELLSDPLSSLREAWERRKNQSSVPREIYRGTLYSSPEVIHGSFRFRKSYYVLMRQILLPFAITALLLSAPVFHFFPGRVNAVFALLSVIPGFLVFYRWLDWGNDIFMVDQGRVYDIDRKPFGKEMTRRQTELAQIENITASQKGFLDWLFNAGEVKMILPGSSDDFVFESVFDPWTVQDQLLIMREQQRLSIHEQQRNQRQEELLALADLLSQELF